MTIVQSDDTVGSESEGRASVQPHTNLDERTGGYVNRDSLGVRQRIAIGVATALIGGAYVLWFDAITHQFGPGGSDFDQLWFAARVLVHGGDPYQAIGPGRAFEWGWPLLYPLPTVVAAIPFAALPLLIARILFAGLSAGFLAFALSKRSISLLVVFLSAAVVDAVRAGQLSVLMTAGLTIDALAFALVLKPPFGLALLAATARRRAVVVTVVAGLLLTSVAFALQPGWLIQWLDAVRGAGHVRTPIFTLGGPLLVLALFRWRRVDARILLACACIPHTPVVYDVVPLVALVRNLREGVAFAVLTYAAMLAQMSLITGLPADAAATRAAWILNFAIYLPALALVFSRPAEPE